MVIQMNLQYFGGRGGSSGIGGVAEQTAHRLIISMLR